MYKLHELKYGRWDCYSRFFAYDTALNLWWPLEVISHEPIHIDMLGSDGPVKTYERPDWIDKDYEAHCDAILSHPLMADKQYFKVWKSYRSLGFLKEILQRKEFHSEYTDGTIILMEHDQFKKRFNILLKVIEHHNNGIKALVLNTDRKGTELLINISDNRPLRKLTNDEKIQYL